MAGIGRYGTFFSEWNSSALVRDVTRRGKKKRMLTPMTFSLIHATDFADRTKQHIIPPLKAGALVLADRYIYTAFARDVARGVNHGWVMDWRLRVVRTNLHGRRACARWNMSTAWRAGASPSPIRVPRAILRVCPDLR